MLGRQLDTRGLAGPGAQGVIDGLVALGRARDRG